MPRFYETWIHSSANLFSALQLQPKALSTLAFGGIHGWFNDILGVSHRNLVADYNLGFVVHGLSIVYVEPTGYFDADRLEAATSAALLNDGKHIEFTTTVSVRHRVAARITTTLVPLFVAEHESYSAVPSVVEEPLLSQFEPAERQERRFASPLVERLARLESAPKVAEGAHRLRLVRHQCEFADQWYYSEAIGFISEAREILCVDAKGSHEALRSGLTLPVSRIDMQFTRPAYLFDDLAVRTRCVESGGEVLFAHDIDPAEASGKTFATAVETFVKPTA